MFRGKRTIFAVFIISMYDTANIKIEEYNYPLPNERIAKFPLEKRDKSKLLVRKDGVISERAFNELPDILPKDSLLLFNHTKVVKARLLFKKETGASIEIFCLEPVEPVNDFQLAYEQKSPVVWKCFIGNAKRWKSGTLIQKFSVGNVNVMLKAEKKEQLTEGFLLEFSWDNNHVLFIDILNNAGYVPIPPYLNRMPVEDDTDRYQTVYAKNNGSVAAPTAGLHFTDNVIEKIHDKGIETDKLTLHVGAGTFKPVVSETISSHEMHVEKIIVSLLTLLHLRDKINDTIIPVGTTSMRTLESLFWLALKINNNDVSMKVEQWDPYQLEVPDGFTPSFALDVLIGYLEKNKLSEIKAETKLMIAPGYQFRFARGLVTNFHQPKSTLLLLVSAMIGDSWKDVYNFALENDFRFLSYGDSCLFLK